MSLPPRRPLIYFISDGSLTDENYAQRSPYLLDLIDASVRRRIPLVQLREKALSSRNLFDLASSAVRIASLTQTHLLINERLDIAIASKADGVHLTSNSIQPDVVRKAAPDGFIIGASTHTLDEIERAENGRADFAVFGPIFETPGKGSVVGLDKLREVVRTSVSFPILALGGIDESNYHDALETGAAGFAAIRFLNDLANLEMLSKEFDL